MSTEQQLFDQETWTQLPAYFEQLPEPVRLHVWGDEDASRAERQAIRLGETLSDRFSMLSSRFLPRRQGHDFYPVIGVMGVGDSGIVDYGLRFIGLPVGYQMTSLVAAIQSVSFHGMTSEAQTRILLSRLTVDVRLELITTANDQVGGLMAQRAFNMAVISPHVRCFVIMADAFPKALIRYSVSHLPHLVINGKVHISGAVSEEALLRQMAVAIRE